MDKKTPKASNEPFFWGGFGAGGMWSAVVSPIIILLIGIVLPLTFSTNGGSTTSIKIAGAILSFFMTPIGLLLILATIALPLWCGMHRIYHLLHDLKIHLPFGKTIFYGTAILLSLLAFYYTVILLIK